MKTITISNYPFDVVLPVRFVIDDNYFKLANEYSAETRFRKKLRLEGLEAYLLDLSTRIFAENSPTIRAVTISKAACGCPPPIFAETYKHLGWNLRRGLHDRENRKEEGVDELVAEEILASHPDEILVLIAGDGDHAHAVQYVRARGTRVIVVGFEYTDRGLTSRVNWQYRNQVCCDYYFDFFASMPKMLNSMCPVLIKNCFLA